MGITILSGCLMAFTRNLIHAALALFVVLFGIAALYVFSGADFPAVSQLILYVGGVLVVIIFGVMLTQRKADQPPLTGLIQPVTGIVVPLFLMLFVGGIFSLHDWEQSLWIKEKANISLSTPIDTVPLIGTQTLTQYLFPFEVLSFLLLLALTGAAYIGRNKSDS